MQSFPIEFVAEVLSTEKRQYTNKNGEEKTFLNATLYSPYTGAVGTMGVDNEGTLLELESYKRQGDVSVSAEFNPVYKNIRIVGVRGYED